MQVARAVGNLATGEGLRAARRRQAAGFYQIAVRRDVEFARQYQNARKMRRATVPLSDGIGRQMGFIGSNEMADRSLGRTGDRHGAAAPVTA
jgi:hypothetical protein